MATRAPITLLHEEATQGVEGRQPILIAGTYDRLFRYTADGSWIMLHAAANCDDGERYSARFLAAQLSGAFLFGHTRGGFWTYVNGAVPEPDGDTYSYLTPVDDLIVLGIEQASGISQLKGFFFIGGLKVAGVLEPGLMHWSDFEDPRAWIPGGESQAGYVSFGSDHYVTSLPMGNSLIVYCRKSIWMGTYVGEEIVWQWERIYSGDNVPRYPRAVVDLGDAHMYLSDNTIFMLVRGERTPRLIPWLDDLSGIIFKGPREELLLDLPPGVVTLPKGRIGGDCLMPCGFYDSNDQLVHFSWQDSEVDAEPKWSVVLSLQHHTSCLVDHGFTAGTMTRQSTYGTSETFRHWMFRTSLCSDNPVPRPNLNEHTPYPPNSPEPGTPDTIEEWCQSLAGTCFTVCPPCHGPARLLMASAHDYCLKEFRWSFDRREMVFSTEDGGAWNNVPMEGALPGTAVGPNPYDIATYAVENYATLFQTDLVMGRTYTTAFDRIEPGLARLDSDPPMFGDTTGDMPWPFHVQGAAAASARCTSWSPEFIDLFACAPGGTAAKSYLMGEENPVLQISVEGHYVGYRFWCGKPGNIGPVAFTGLGLEFSESGGKR